jgi:hypothetical protein
MSGKGQEAPQSFETRESSRLRVSRGDLFGELALLDDRGRKVPMRHPIRWGDEFSWRRNMSSTERRKWAALIGLNTIATFAYMAFGVSLLKNEWVFLAGCLVSVLLSFSWGWCFDRTVKGPGTALARLHRGLCGSCKYPIETTSPQSDGCTVCPECGAAWKLPPPPPNNPA